MSYFNGQLNLALSCLLERGRREGSVDGDRANFYRTEEGLKDALEKLQAARDDLEKLRGLPAGHRRKEKAMSNLRGWLRFVNKTKAQLGRHGSDRDTQHVQ